MKQVQGYIHLIRNDPTGRGLWYYTKEKAQEAQRVWAEGIKKWPVGFNQDYWKEPPQVGDVFAVVIEGDPIV